MVLIWVKVILEVSMQSKKTIILLEFTGLVLYDFTKQNVPNSSYFLGDIKVNGYRGFTIKEEMGMSGQTGR